MIGKYEKKLINKLRYSFLVVLNTVYWLPFTISMLLKNIRKNQSLTKLGLVKNSI